MLAELFEAGMMFYVWIYSLENMGMRVSEF